MAASPPPPPQAAVHPAVQPLSYLLGTWRGQGEGNFPTISPFKYTEELQFSHSPIKPVIDYSSKTWKLSTGEPMHSESGYWRPKLDGSIEVVIAQSTGLVEVQVKDITRVFEMANGELTYVVEMATNLTSLQSHLKVVLKKL